MPVVPVLLDKTPLRPELAAFEGVDFRDVAVHPRFTRVAQAASGILAATMLVMLGGMWMTLGDFQSDTVGAALPPSADSPAPYFSWLVPVALFGLVAWRWRRKRRQRRVLAQRILRHIEAQSDSTAHVVEDGNSACP